MRYRPESGPTITPAVIEKEEKHMNGKRLDIGLLVVWLGTFLIVAMVHPGIANFLIAWSGAIALGWYNAVIRHDRKTDALRTSWQRRAGTAPAAHNN
jgi:hypothetical protein